jgi:KUP system potassium uptake protein
METPDVQRLMGTLGASGLPFEWSTTTFFLGREHLIASHRSGGMAIWRERLFSLMARNAQRAGTFYRIPPDRVVELGAEVEL